MIIALSALAITQLVVIAIWLWQHFLIGRIRRDGLEILITNQWCDLPPVTVIVPARNEGRSIEFCIRSILSQDYPLLSVLVADDRSEDRTADIIRELAASDARLRLVSIDALPAGWMGKSHALWTAARQVNAPWILMIDADCRLLPRGLASMVRHAIEREADLLTLWPRDGSSGFWERLLVPLCGAMIVICYGRAATGDTVEPEAFANGQFLLIRRDAYQAVGGHESVRHALIEDIPLARLVKARGYRVLSAIGSDVGVVRMYASLGELWRGWQRIFVGVLRPNQILLCMGSIVAGSLPPFIVLPLVVPRWLDGTGGWCAVFGWLSVFHLLALMSTSVRFFSLARCRLRYLWIYPLSCIGVLAILAAALTKRVRATSIVWRGTTYTVCDGAVQLASVKNQPADAVSSPTTADHQNPAHPSR